MKKIAKSFSFIALIFGFILHSWNIGAAAPQTCTSVNGADQRPTNSYATCISNGENTISININGVDSYGVPTTVHALAGPGPDFPRVRAEGRNGSTANAQIDGYAKAINDSNANAQGTTASFAEAIAENSSFAEAASSSSNASAYATNDSYARAQAYGANSAYAEADNGSCVVAQAYWTGPVEAKVKDGEIEVTIGGNRETFSGNVVIILNGAIQNLTPGLINSNCRRWPISEGPSWLNGAD